MTALWSASLLSVTLTAAAAAPALGQAVAPMVEPAIGGTQSAPSIPNFSGIWSAAEVVKKHGKISLAGKGYPTPSNQCRPGGVPYVFWNFLMEMFQEPDHITNLPTWQ